jgi:hypothetical protein
MTLSADAVAEHHHPSPHRHRVSLATLMFGLFGGPLAWLFQLIVNFALASHTCFPSSMPRTSAVPGWGGIWPVLLLVNVAAIVVAATAAGFSYRGWDATSEEHPGATSHLVEAGEGRTRFLALCGVIASLGFLGATAFDTIALLIVPQCPG